MSILDLNAVAKAKTAAEPYPHFIGSGFLRPESAAAVSAAFPTMDLPGFFPKDDIAVAGAFADLLAEVESPAFDAAVSAKLGMDLVGKPRLITVRRWSATGDGRIHTDSQSKIATVLIYLNEGWGDNGAGRLRVLRGPKDFEDYTTEISPVIGSVFGFKRTENSWHGHLPFSGERRVVQVTWLIDESKLARKKRTSRFTGLLKRLNTFRKS